MKTGRWFAGAGSLGTVVLFWVGCGSSDGFSALEPLDSGFVGSTGGQSSGGGSAGAADASADGGMPEAASGSGGGGGATEGGTVTTDGSPPETAGGCETTSTYYADADGDGFGNPQVTVEACARPEGYVANSDDCYDGNDKAKPGQDGWFKEDRGDGSFDYDCDGDGVQHWPEQGDCGFAICGLNEGWEGPVPSCGVDGDYIVGCSLLAICVARTEVRTQECH